jgi:HEPN domain-containing protein
VTDRTLLDRAFGYLRTAEAAFGNGDHPQAYENARTASELGAKHMLAGRSIATSGKDHNVAPQLVQANLWPGGDAGRRLSKFLNDYTRGVYGLAEPVSKAEAERAIHLAGQVLAKAQKG